MGANNSKTFLTVSCLVLATTTSEAASKGSSWGLVKGFASKSQNNAAFIDHAAASAGIFIVRGGESTTADVESKGAEAELSLDDKVQAAMKKLGISPPDGENEGTADEDNANCKDGVCELPKAEETSDEESASSNTSTTSGNMDPHEMAVSISKDMDVGTDLAMAAIGATATLDNNERVYNEQAARDMIQHELDVIATIPEDSDNVKQLVEEGYDSFLCRRALAFADGNMDDARAILLADKLDEEEEERLAKEEQEKEDEEAAMRAELRKEHEASQSKQPDMVEVKADFDPTTLPTTTTAATPKTQTQSSSGNTGKPDGMPGPARKEDVVFDASPTQIQELVLESPVPVLLDVYADWCGPCKALTPALEEMAVKAGGIFRLVKVNSDNNKPVSAALEVTALPTVFGIRDGKIVHMFQGMPRSEEMMKNFMMGLFGAAPFSPPVTADEKLKYDELTNKLIKTAGSACFSFSARERLTDRITTKLGELKDDESVPDVEGTATLIRTLLSNIVKNPYEQKYRKINLENKKIAQMIGTNASCLGVLKIVGFAKDNGSNEMSLGKGKKVINVAPLVVARDCIDNWMLRNRKEMASLARKRKDEADHAKLQAEREAAGDNEEEEVEEEVEEVDETACQLKLRLDGKKKVHDVTLHADDPLSKVLDALDIDTTTTEEEIQITCVAKRMVVKSSDDAAMKKTLGEYGLKPKAAIVVKVGGNSNNSSSSLKERMAEKKNLKKGSHTMQSIGIYAKDDNNKAELIDGGGGVWYEHDVSDDEGEEEEKSEEGKDENNTTEDSAEGDADEPNDEGVDAEESQ